MSCIECFQTSAFALPKHWCVMLCYVMLLLNKKYETPIIELFRTGIEPSTLKAKAYTIIT